METDYQVRYIGGTAKREKRVVEWNGHSVAEKFLVADNEYSFTLCYLL
jgi:hypothetical protein